MPPRDLISKVIHDINSIKKMAGIDPKWLNRTLSHLDNAWAASYHIVKQGSLADTPEAKTSETCICPFPEVVDSSCSIHGQK